MTRRFLRGMLLGGSVPGGYTYTLVMLAPRNNPSIMFWYVEVDVVVDVISTALEDMEGTATDGTTTATSEQCRFAELLPEAETEADGAFSKDRST